MLKGVQNVPNGYSFICGYRYVSRSGFLLNGSGKEPVRECLKALNKQDKKTIGDDIKTDCSIVFNRVFNRVRLEWHLLNNHRLKPVGLNYGLKVRIRVD